MIKCQVGLDICADFHILDIFLVDLKVGMVTETKRDFFMLGTSTIYLDLLLKRSFAQDISLFELRHIWVFGFRFELNSDAFS